MVISIQAQLTPAAVVVYHIEPTNKQHTIITDFDRIRCEKKLAAMAGVLERERADKEARDEGHKNELHMVEEVLNGRYIDRALHANNRSVCLHSHIPGERVLSLSY